MSMTPTWATAQPNSSGRWFTQDAGRGTETRAANQISNTHAHTHTKSKVVLCFLLLVEKEACARTYEQAAVGASVYGQLCGGGVALLDEVLSRALEVGEAVLLVGQHPGCTAGGEKKQKNKT